MQFYWLLSSVLSLPLPSTITKLKMSRSINKLLLKWKTKNNAPKTKIRMIQYQKITKKSNQTKSPKKTNKIENQSNNSPFKKPHQPINRKNQSYPKTNIKSLITKNPKTLNKISKKISSKIRRTPTRKKKENKPAKKFLKKFKMLPQMWWKQ